MNLNRLHCPITKSLQYVGDKWILLILREAFFGFTRFDQFQENLNISKSVLSNKLTKMLADGLLIKHSYKEGSNRKRFEYQLTKKGKGLSKVMIGLLEWGNDYVVQKGEKTIKVVEKNSGKASKIKLLNEGGEKIDWDSIYLTTAIKRHSSEKP
tara:strand:+ start:1024 stop:1485 length:462 start_codon:yes stop_codon:yes gene_type:complete